MSQRKCEEYWPQVAGESKTHGEFTVRTVSTDEFTDYSTTVIHLIKDVNILSLSNIRMYISNATSTYVIFDCEVAFKMIFVSLM